jgi:hypothetical protein
MTNITSSNKVLSSDSSDKNHTFAKQSNKTNDHEKLPKNFSSPGPFRI